MKSSKFMRKIHEKFVDQDQATSTFTFGRDLIKHNLVVFRGGEGALQVHTTLLEFSKLFVLISQFSFYNIFLFSFCFFLYAHSLSVSVLFCLRLSLPLPVCLSLCFSLNLSLSLFQFTLVTVSISFGLEGIIVYLALSSLPSHTSLS